MDDTSIVTIFMILTDTLKLRIMWMIAIYVKVREISTVVAALCVGNRHEQGLIILHQLSDSESACRTLIDACIYYTNGSTCCWSIYPLNAVEAKYLSPFIFCLLFA